MTIQEFSDRYYLHDSIVSSINYNKDAETLEIVLDFCYWAQEGYDKSHPATGPLIITFKGVSKYDGPLGEFDWWGISTAEDRNDSYYILMDDDYHNMIQEIIITPTDIDVKGI